MLFVPERRVRLLVRPHARAGVEICDITSSQQPVTVRPHARAGVEMSPVMRILMLSAVRPHARAGVEMMRVPSQAKRMRVRPHARAGVEIPACPRRSTRRRVRPHARAGVEMSSRLRRSPATLFALTRGRELNVPMASSITSCCSSPLTRRRRGCEGMRRRGAPFRGGMWLRVIGRFRLLGRPLQSLLLLLPLVLIIFWPPTGRCRRLACVGAEPRA